MTETEAGQATVELIALLPLLAAIALVVLALAAGHAAREAADQAAVAGAIARLQGADPVKAARAASPGWSRTAVRVGGDRVTVEIRPRVPGFIARAIGARRTVVDDPAATR
ncbi:MAG: hypothetical protein AAGC46_07700 [Solirubrobacteraceae bacterium]|nr:hypothetical protein [Patulibacter sp.]